MNERAANELRKLEIHPGFTEMAAGSALICAGRTRVLCTASVQEGVPPFLRDTGRGWLTAEYAMLPGSTPQRKARDGAKRDGRGVEIGRLDRPFPARRLRPFPAGRAHHLYRLRRFAGGRRHAHRGGDGRIRGPVPGGQKADGCGQTRRFPHRAPGGGGVCGHCGRRAHARFGLRL